MRTLLFAVAMLVAGSAVGHADNADDYVACMIRQSAVALHAQGEKKDTNAAQEVAYAKCKEPKGLNDEDEGLGDFVNLAVMGIAASVWGVE